MAGFRSLARQVRDSRNDLALRRYSLRKCLERFAPYGHRATWDHLCSRAGFAPEDRSPDPRQLLFALDELEAARAVWLAYEDDFAERRRREKHEGLRSPGSIDDWHRLTWGGFGVAWCDDPELHPGEPLAVVLGRLIDALERSPGTACPVCAGRELGWKNDLAHEPSSAPVCTDCGIVVPRPVLTEAALDRAWRARELVTA
ncbi:MULTISPECIES: hypothetical protein [Streptomyces]|uniref:Uncharacterized protein n=1 Tax=Streptomyces albus (strain ATCC 21838 / DSM 41398 / FERM P-419 / JCM 4703 / NBRC 107858) TaxID=1081613 RepID=A0A0B5F7X7_STRA4|nr:hypothetical protein [Streptomyces sp. SCSIO ZS0520]AJE86572.1 hypothetical protein SLNWT_6196 [Streptomyces albus]AOU80876.1 hypothetical protein SLNHY_6185 [Streptomyces albus]AYN36579.1 hypothetical protein DUI70_6085 [Streptomyces albus]